MIYRCSLKSCPHFSTPCEFDDFNAKCPIGETDNFEDIHEPWKEFFCLVVGSRTFTDYHFFSKKMDKVLSSKQDKKIILVSGGAKGTDTMAERYAKSRNYKMYVINADWNKGSVAGYERNEEMHRFISEHDERGCIAFWDGDSKGTTHSFELAKKYDNQLKIINIQ